MSHSPSKSPENDENQSSTTCNLTFSPIEIRQLSRHRNSRPHLGARHRRPRVIRVSLPLEIAKINLRFALKSRKARRYFQVCICNSRKRWQ